MKHRVFRDLFITFILLIPVILCSGEGQIDISTAPFTISNPGSYIVVKDLIVAQTGKHAITIESDDVTVDLGGHTIKGPGKTAGNVGSGIYINGAENVTVKNGTIRDWRKFAINASSSNYCRFENITCRENYTGIATGNNCILINNICTNNSEEGIWCYGGSVVKNNVCSNNKTGILANGSHLENNTCTGNETGISTDSSIVLNNLVQSNTGVGINIYNATSARGNNCFYNYKHGIEAGFRCTIQKNTCSFNGTDPSNEGYGIYISTGQCSVIENELIENDKGLVCKDVNNYIAQNRAQGHGGAANDYDIVTGNTLGAGDLANVSF